jgi:hypothetical protein
MKRTCAFEASPFLLLRNVCEVRYEICIYEIPAAMFDIGLHGNSKCCILKTIFFMYKTPAKRKGDGGRGIRGCIAGEKGCVTGK